MSTLLHRLRTLITRVLLFAGIAQIAAPGVAALQVIASEPALAERSSEDREHLGDAHLFDASKYVEIDEFDARRVRPKVRRAVMSTELPKVFWEESVRIRVEDRRNCRPPNSRG